MPSEFASSLPYIPLAAGAGISGGVIAPLLLMGAFGAAFFLADVSAAILAIVLSRGDAALVYLVAEAVPVENIEAGKSILPTYTLFSGFLALQVIKLLERG
jgi:hypothetical protein